METDSKPFSWAFTIGPLTVLVLLALIVFFRLRSYEQRIHEMESNIEAIQDAVL